MGEVITYPASDLSLVTPPETGWERERQAFRGLLPALRDSLDGQYVAIFPVRERKAVPRRGPH